MEQLYFHFSERHTFNASFSSIVATPPPEYGGRMLNGILTAACTSPLMPFLSYCLILKTSAWNPEPRYDSR